LSHAVLETGRRAADWRRPDMIPSDDVILHRVREGDLAQYAVLVQRHQRRLYAIATSILRNHAEAEDTVQEAHLHAFLHLDQFAGRSTVLAWLSAITRNAALMRLRGHHPFRLSMNFIPLDSVILSSAAAGAGCDIEAGLLECENAMAVRRNVGELPQKYQAVLIMRDLQGLTTRETATNLKASAECVKTRLHRARGMLRRRLAQQNESPAAGK
jgi:RNA polymerase sigma-70 factor (ECF subfamily)